MAEEKNYENRIKKFLKDNDIYYIKQFGCAFTKAGLCDLTCCVNGRFVGIEVKAEKGRATELQLLNIEKIRAAGGIALISRPSEFPDLKKLLLSLKAENI